MPFYYFGAYAWLHFITISPVSLKPRLFRSQMLKRNLFLPVIHRLMEQIRYIPHTRKLSPQGDPLVSVIKAHCIHPFIAALIHTLIQQMFSESLLSRL